MTQAAIGHRAVLALTFVAIVLCAPAVFGQEPGGANWKQAERYTRKYLDQFSYDTSVRPNWIGETDRFWYSFRSKDGRRYWLVDPDARTKSPLFDHADVAAKISEATGEAQVAHDLKMSSVRVSEDGKKMTFTAGKFQLTYTFATKKMEAKKSRSRGSRPTSSRTGIRGIDREELRRRGRSRGGRGRSRGTRAGKSQQTAPDKRAQVFAKGYNLFYVEASPPPVVATKDDDAKGEKPAAAVEKKSKTKAARAADSSARKGETDTRSRGNQPPDLLTSGVGTQEKKSAARKQEGAASKQEKKADLQDENKASTKQEKTTDAKQEKKHEKAASERKGEPMWPSERRKLRAKNKKPVFNEKAAIQLTKDGVKDFGFGSGNEKKSSVSVTWSPDSKAFYVRRRDSREIAELAIIDSVANPRPKIRTYKYAMPGEDRIRKTTLQLFHRDTRKLIEIEPRWKDESYLDVRWLDNGELRVLRRSRVLRDIEYGVVDPKTGKVKTLFMESNEKGYLVTQPMRTLENKDFIWWSERTGWGHFYLYGPDGQLKNAITKGAFRASRIVSIDEKNGVMWFRGNGREPGENVYYEHLYRVNLDGTGLTLLNPGDAHHTASLSPTRSFLVDNTSRVDRAPTSTLRDAQGREVMKLEETDLSRLFEAGWRLPETFKVKAADGVTDLYGNMWKPFDFDPAKSYPIILHVYPGPQQEGVTHTFSVHSSRMQLAQLGFIVIQVGHRGGAPTRDRAYASYGYWNLRDYGLEDKKSAVEQLAARHPWIDVERVGMYGHSGGGFMTAAALLQKPYNDFFKVGVASAGNHDNNIYNNSWSERYHGLKEVEVETEEAKKAAATRRAPPKVSTKKSGDEKTGERSGSTSDEKKSGSGKALVHASAQEKKATTTKQEVKKTVARQEKKETENDEAEAKETRFEIHIPTNAELAANLKGKLLLVHGEIDNNVHPANTMRLVDALIKANKRFDMLIIPGASHGFGRAQAYFTRRMWEYFAEHLIGDRPSGADMPVPAPRTRTRPGTTRTGRR